MQSKFDTYLKQQLNITGKKDKIMLAVSGGIDSVAMFQLFRKSFRDIAVAHCNFQLRGEESEADEAFVKSLCDDFRLPFFSKRFETNNFAKEKGQSIQMAARELRYLWFEELCNKNNYDFIAVAHHQDDAIETFFINLLRGTGLAGLSGIKPKSGNLIRPMLCFSRNEIEQYVEEHNYAYRTDSSNASRKYKRNYLRLDILPKLTELNPGFNQTILKEMVQFDEIHQVFSNAVKEKMQEIVVEDKNNKLIFLPKQELLRLEPLRPYLFQYLRDYGFNSADIDDVCTGIQYTTQAVFFSGTHRLMRESDRFVLAPLDDQPLTDSYILDGDSGSVQIPGTLSWSTVDREKAAVSKDERSAYIDYDQLEFPLQLRKWKKGDYFYPLGMNQRKKLSDFFTDRKFTTIQKEHIMVVISSGRIVWIVGERLDNRFRITGSTKKVLIMALEEKSSI